MTTRKTKNQIICERSRAVDLEIQKVWGTNGTFLYMLEIKNTYQYKEGRVVLGIFETQQECDEWYFKWKEKIKTFQKNSLSEF
ncbi:MAG: hypothetical protein LBH30_03135 [Prevotellaceae bacterium]|jgi:hypothetical protein|nr:hypothetical protein [Prevotellaceae bacterium]